MGKKKPKQEQLVSAAVAKKLGPVAERFGYPVPVVAAAAVGVAVGTDIDLDLPEQMVAFLSAEAARLGVSRDLFVSMCVRRFCDNVLAERDRTAAVDTLFDAVSVLEELVRIHGDRPARNEEAQQAWARAREVLAQIPDRNVTRKAVLG